MTGETLRDCPFCGGKVDSDMIGTWVSCSECIEPDGDVARDKWQARALVPALDRVIAEVEDRLTALWKDVNSQPHTPNTTHRTIERLEIMATELQVLRAEQSADAGGESCGNRSVSHNPVVEIQDSGETEGGS